MKKSVVTKQGSDSDFVPPGTLSDGTTQRRVLIKQNNNDDDFIDKSPDMIPHKTGHGNSQMQSMYNVSLGNNASAINTRSQGNEWDNRSSNTNLSKSQPPTDFVSYNQVRNNHIGSKESCQSFQEPRSRLGRT